MCTLMRNISHSLYLTHKHIKAWVRAHTHTLTGSCTHNCDRWNRAQLQCVTSSQWPDPPGGFSTPRSLFCPASIEPKPHHKVAAPGAPAANWRPSVWTPVAVDERKRERESSGSFSATAIKWFLSCWLILFTTYPWVLPPCPPIPPHTPLPTRSAPWDSLWEGDESAPLTSRLSDRAVGLNVNLRPTSTVLPLFLHRFLQLPFSLPTSHPLLAVPYSRTHQALLGWTAAEPRMEGEPVARWKPVRRRWRRRGGSSRQKGKWKERCQGKE